jgi:hypothetical protein
MLTVPAVDRPVGDRARQTVFVHRAGLLRVESDTHLRAAETAWQRAQALIATSTQLVAASQRICAGLGRPDQAA